MSQKGYYEGPQMSPKGHYLEDAYHETYDLEGAQMSRRRDSAAIDIEQLFKSSYYPTQSRPTVFKVGDRLRQVNEKDYEPKIVSIGPIHHGKDQCHIMEQHKVRFLQELLKESNDLTLDKLVYELRKIENKARQCYSESIIDDFHYLPDKFLTVLLVDGCFIVQLIRKYYSRKSEDPIVESETIIQIIHDLLLFENQLPFFVLECLFDMTKIDENPNDNLRRLILFLVGDVVPWFDVSKLNSQFLPSHLLGLVYQCISTKIPANLHPKHLLGRVYRYSFTGGKGNNLRAKRKKSRAIHINSASELKEVAGIRLQMSEDNNITLSDHLSDFVAGKVLKLPPLEVSGETESLLRNLMAYEQLQLNHDHPRHMIDYVFFLHCLTRSVKDVKVLRYSGIIKNYLGGDHMILEMLDRLGKNFMRSSEFTYSGVFESLNIHSGDRRSRWIAKLRIAYFRNPWFVLIFLVVVSLLLLTSAQTYYVILGYNNRRI